MKITIKDIADRAGVSKATVSRVLNNSKPVSEDVRNKVLKVIEKTNFKPNAVARSLSLKKSHLIGIILPDLSNPVFSRIISGIENYIRDKDYSLLITATDFNADMKIQHIRILKDKGVDGLILVTDHGNDEFHEELLNFKKPVVMIGSDSAIETIPVVKIDNYRAASEATQYLLDLGHQRIAMIRGPLTDPHSGMERYEGFKNTMESKGLFNPDLIVEGWYSFDDGYKGMTSLLKQKNAPSAVFCACDLLAIGAMKCALEQGYRVPEEIAFIGFDDVEMSRMYNPSLSTIRQPFEEKGKLAVRQLIEMLERPAGEVNPELMKSHTLTHRLIVRQSTEKSHGR